ncbi:Cilia-and flagella-associated protein 52 [Rhizoctonia solani]|uniref:Cilia-and flagella-associated protein 52 n=1 Tax=Rhizoctonia solani TaxID=456999 RepID=A0A0K6FQQ0_9AGAM|nr:Cilia-and flagella-associated protein 52 [Rhizoctonia solani]
MEPRKRANQALEQEESSVKRVKHTIKALFRAEGSTGTGASCNPIPREDTLENEQSNSGSAADCDANQLITNSTTENNQQDIIDASLGPRNLRVDASSTKRKGLKNLLKTGVLGPVTDALGPIKQVAGIFVECVDAYKVAEGTKVEHDELVTRLEGLFEDLVVHLQDGCSQPMTASMNRLCKSIQEELETIKDAKGKSTGSRLLATNDKADEILACYRRAEGYLERLSLNANLSMWKIAHEQATNCQSDRMFSLIDRLPSVLPARYNSAEGGAWKRRECTPDTRVQEISKILGWVRNKGEGTVYWLNGMAGTGKTTIAYSVCAGLDSGHMLGASFFCSRLQEECRNVNKIIPSIAYQLARFSRPFHHALCNALEKDPDAHGRILQTQFNALIKDPMLQVQHTLPEELTVVIDALDECEDKETTRRMLEVLVNESTNLPIRFVLSSRPEPEIRDEMTEQVKSRLVLHELNKDDVRVDIETYLRTELARMKPSEEQLAALVEKAGILFIYAATAVRYIGYDNFRRNPHARLRNLLDAQRNQKSKKNEEIDELYKIVLDAALNDQGLEDEERSDIEQILRTVVCARDPLTVSGLSELLQIYDTDRVRAALRPLWSVLHIVGVDELVTTLHASFPDFILDSSRSHAHYCDSEAHHRTLAEHCLERIERAQPQFNICGLESSYLPDERVPDIGKRVSNTILPDLLYACKYWAGHIQLESGKSALPFAAKLRDFLCTRLLLWMEVLNLNKQIKTSIDCMKLVVEWCKLEGDQGLVELANDAQRFVETFASNPVSQSTPHIYISMLAFWPRDAPVAKHYAQSTRGPIEAEGTGLDRRQSAHISTWTFKAGVTEMAVSQDGRYIALGIEKEVVVVDSSTGQIVLGPLYGLPEDVGSIMFSPDQTRILAASRPLNKDHTLIVIGWDTRTGDRVLGPLDLHDNQLNIQNAIFSPDCACIAAYYDNYSSVYYGDRRTSDEVRTLRLWDTKDGVILHTWETTDWCMVIAFALDGTLVAAGCVDSLQVWNTQTGKTTLGPLKTGSIDYLAFSHDASRIIHSEHPRKLYLRNSQSGDILHDLSHIHETMAGLCPIRYSPDGRCIAGVSAGEDGVTPIAIHVWGAVDYRTMLGPLKGHTGGISSIIFSPDGSRIISGCSNGLVCTWDVHQRNLPSNSMNTLFIHILSAKFSSDGMRFVTGSKDGLLHIWDSYTGELSVDPIKAHKSEVVAVDFWNDRVVSGSRDGTVSVWNALSGDVVLASVNTGIKETLTAVAYSPNGNLIVTASRINLNSGVEVNLWDVHTGIRVLGPLKAGSRDISTIQFSPDGTRIAGITTYSRSSTVFWDTSDGREVSEPYKPRIKTESISYSPNGAFIALGHHDSTITVWDVYTRTKELKRLTGHSGAVDSVHFSPDSTRLVSSTYEQIWIWDVQTGQMLFELPHGHEQGITSVHYSPDGTRIISISYDMSVRIHDARTNQERALSWAATEYGGSTIGSLEELLGVKARLEAEKERILLEVGEVSESDEDEDRQDESFEALLHPRPPRGTPYVRSNQEPQSQSLPNLDESMRGYRRCTAPVEDTPVPKKHGTRPRVAGPSLWRAPPPILPTVAKEPAAEKLVAEEPVAEEPVAEEPVAEDPTPAELEPPRPASPPPVRADSALMDISLQKQQPRRSSARLPLFRSQSKPPSPSRSQPREALPHDAQGLSSQRPIPALNRRIPGRKLHPSLPDGKPARPRHRPLYRHPPAKLKRKRSTRLDSRLSAMTLTKMMNPRRMINPILWNLPKERHSLMTEASQRATQPPEEVDPASIPLPAGPEDKRRIRELEAEVRRLREEVSIRPGPAGCFAFCSSASATPTAPPPPMANFPKLPIVVARRRQEKGESDGELDEDGEGPHSDLDHALCMMRTGLKTPAAGSKISAGKTPTVPMESMTAFPEEVKTVKLKSRVGPTPKVSIIRVEEDDNCDDVGNNKFAFRRQEDLQSVLERRARQVV